MLGNKKTHEQNLACICCICGRKGKFRNVTKILVEKVRLLQPSYDQYGGVHPTVICDSCRKACREIEKDSEQTRHRVPNLLDYSTIRGPGVSQRTRSRGSSRSWGRSLRAPRRRRRKPRLPRRRRRRKKRRRSGRKRRKPRLPRRRRRMKNRRGGWRRRRRKRKVVLFLKFNFEMLVIPPIKGIKW